MSVYLGYLFQLDNTVLGEVKYFKELKVMIWVFLPVSLDLYRVSVNTGWLRYEYQLLGDWCVPLFPKHCVGGHFRLLS